MVFYSNHYLVVSYDENVRHKGLKKAGISGHFRAFVGRDYRKSDSRGSVNRGYAMRDVPYAVVNSTEAKPVSMPSDANTYRIIVVAAGRLQNSMIQPGPGWMMLPMY